MRKVRLGLGTLAAVAVLCSGVIAVAQDKKAPKKGPACNAIKVQATCEARGDCQWIAALMDPTTNKQKRAAYCKAKPAEPAKK